MLGLYASRLAGSAIAINALRASVVSPTLRSMATVAQQQVGFIGLGRMGKRMVEHLLDSGHSMVVYDNNSLAMDRMLEIGEKHEQGKVEAASSPATVASNPNVRVLFTMLPDVKSAMEVYLGPGGILRAKEGVVPSLLVDCTTVDPISADKLSAAASRASLHKASRPFPGLPKDRPTLVDAPVSGGAHVARAGQLSFMVGGDKAALAAVEPFLHDISKHGHITYCGRHGAASAAKLCNTLVATASMAAVSECLALGQRLGVDPEVMTEVLNHSSGRTFCSDTYHPVPGIMPNVPAANGYRAGLPTDAVIEQLRMLIAAAKEAHSPVPVARHVETLYNRIHDEGLGDKDFSSIYRYVYGSGSASAEWREGQDLYSSQVP